MLRDPLHDGSDAVRSDPGAQDSSREGRVFVCVRCDARVAWGRDVYLWLCWGQLRKTQGIVHGRAAGYGRVRSREARGIQVLE